MTRPKVPKRPRGANLPKAEVLRVLRYLTEYQAEHGMAPTARELAQGLGYSSPSVAQYRLDALLERGLVVVDVGKSRSVRVTEAGRVEAAESNVLDGATDRSFAEALAERIEKIGGSSCFLTLYHPAMADFKKDPWPAIELAIALLMDKPIVVGCPPGRTVPGRLARVADRVVYGGVEEIAAGVAEFMEKSR